MKTIHIQQKGFLIKVGTKTIRTPLIVKCDSELEAQVLGEIEKYNIVAYEIDEGVTKTYELIKPSITKQSEEVSEPVEEITEDITEYVEEEVSEPVEEITEDMTEPAEEITEDVPTVSDELLKKYSLNYIQDSVDERDHIIKLSTPILEEIQTATNIIDYTDDMSPVKNQGSLGSCVGFAVVAMKEYQEQKEHNLELMEGKSYKRRVKNYDLSEQWLYYKCKEIDYWPEEEGTSIRFAMKILNKVGVPCEKAWPYNTSYKGTPESWATMVAKWALGGEYIRLESPEDIISSLGTNGPVSVGVACYSEIFYASSDGVVDYPSDPDTCYGGHAICLVGWNPETQMFKFKNSWGTSWGENGYGYLSYNYIKDFCWDAWEIKDLSVTKEMLKG